MSALAQFEQKLTSIQEQGMFARAQADKEAALYSLLNCLHKHYRQRCNAYERLALTSNTPDGTLESLPFLSIRLFKEIALKTIDDVDIFRVLQSSGTSGQTPSRIYLDKATSARQSKALVGIMQSFIGKQRLPMLIIDCPAVMKSSHFSARAAGIQGMAFFGRKPVYALNDDMTLNIEAVELFAKRHSNEPVLIFGFTFMVWLHFVQALQQANITLQLPKGKLIHSGGWKKLTERQVTNPVFKAGIKATCKINQVHNFYGMAEQVGSVFVECEAGHLHCSTLADVIIREPQGLLPVGRGEEGIIQVLSALPSSYPGASILTEDLGILLGVDDCSCQRKGKYFSVSGRIPRAEVRGCSDTFS